jgi:2-dehydropantoate 2-reductase
MERVVVAGAGSIGCFVGGCLAAAGRHVELLGRPRIADELRRAGLRLTDYAGFAAELEPDEVRIETDPTVLANADVVLVAVKSGDTPSVAETIANQAPSEVTVVSLQNGVGQREVIARALPRARIAAAVVPFNVVHRGEGRFHKGTEGQLLIEGRVDDRLGSLLDVPGCGAAIAPDIDGVKWGKLLMNLNNALNALSGLPLKVQLSDRRYRRVLAAMVEEGLKATRAAGIRAKRVGKVLPRAVPFMLRLPDPLFERAAASMLKIDPQARSSMAEDLDRGRATEVGYLQGAVVDLGRAHGVPTPVNERVMAAVRAREDGEVAPVDPDALLHGGG